MLRHVTYTRGIKSNLQGVHLLRTTSKQNRDMYNININKIPTKEIKTMSFTRKASSQIQICYQVYKKQIIPVTKNVTIQITISWIRILALDATQQHKPPLPQASSGVQIPCPGPLPSFSHTTSQSNCLQHIFVQTDCTISFSPVNNEKDL